MPRQRRDGTPEQTLSLELADNRLLTDLFGENDSHLSRIENALDVFVSPRGNRLLIKGGPESARACHAILTDLYARLQKGLEVSMQEVDAAIRHAASGQGGTPVVSLADARFQLRAGRQVLTPRSPKQAEYLEAMQANDLTLGLGPAGTGKTYLAVAFAVSQLLGNRVDRIILSRPAVEAGERLGFLPGDLKEKIDPYLQPLYDALRDTLGADQMEKRIAAQSIEVAPLAFMRGRTLSNSFVILDEAQNTTRMQMKMFLTRLGEGSRMVITGDPSQIDLPPRERSGLLEARKVLAGVEGVAEIAFGQADVVRHPLVTRIVNAYSRYEASAAPVREGGATGGDGGSSGAPGGAVAADRTVAPDAIRSGDPDPIGDADPGGTGDGPGRSAVEIPGAGNGREGLGGDSDAEH